MKNIFDVRGAFARIRIRNFLAKEARIPELSYGAKQYALGLIKWLLRAQDSTDDGGVSEGYKVRDGKWSPSYPETTGYIICSLLEASRIEVANPKKLRLAAVRMGKWLVSTQLECGAFPGGNIEIKEKVPTVFNTGQILSGLTDLIAYDLDTEGSFAQAAESAAQWLVKIQDDDGAWRKGRSPLTSGCLHSYDVLTANALGKYGLQCNCTASVCAALRNGEHLIRSQDENSWFPHMSFLPEMAPYTHTVAYTIQGLLEIGANHERADFVNVALQAAARVRSLADKKYGWVPGQLDSGYRAASEWTSMTGNAQMAVIWFRLASFTGECVWSEAARRALRFNCALQEMDMRCLSRGRRGGLRGAYPGHLGYGRYWYMNWTQKYQLDALLSLIAEGGSL